MASKINKVKIDVTANTKKAEKNLENLSKAETRLGQTTASAGRQFSSQAQGLGGLVAAYAGAAANVFALQQAFDALRRAAQAETIVQGTKALALEIAASGGRILENVREITQGQLTLAEAAQNTNIALSAGFGAEQIERLTQVSIKASRALGRSLTDALTRVTRGAAKLEPELLDELGIFTRIDPAVEKYAAGLNVAASSLTNYERRQAFVNAVIEEGEKKFSTINTAVPSSQKSIERLITALTDLATEFGQVVASTLQPFIDFIADNTGVALLAFLGVLRLVFGKAGSLIGAFSKNSILSIDKFASNLLSKAKISKDALQELTAAAGADFRGGTGIGKGFPTKAAGVSGEAQEQFNVARQQLTSGSIENAAQLNTNIRVLENFSKQAKLGTKAQENLNNVIAQGNAQL